MNFSWHSLSSTGSLDVQRHLLGVAVQFSFHLQKLAGPQFAGLASAKDWANSAMSTVTSRTPCGNFGQFARGGTRGTQGSFGPYLRSHDTGQFVFGKSMGFLSGVVIAHSWLSSFLSKLPPT